MLGMQLLVKLEYRTLTHNTNLNLISGTNNNLRFINNLSLGSETNLNPKITIINSQINKYHTMTTLQVDRCLISLTINNQEPLLVVKTTKSTMVALNQCK